ncbi:MAG: TIGR02757 family protein, partial [Bacteroidales bacterium]
LMKLLDNNPYSFITQASEREIQNIQPFVHRTFNSQDLIGFIRSLQIIYKNKGGLQPIFEKSYLKTGDIKQSLIYFRKLFIQNCTENRTLKHIADVEKGSSAKRLNMFLRWMVRKDANGVDFGLWTGIPMHALYIPLDVHVGNIARGLEILKRGQNDWKSVEELTSVLRTFDPNDPVKYDYALFGIGVFEKNKKNI